MRVAVGDFGWCRFVRGRGAARDRRDPGVMQLQAVVDSTREGLVRESVRVERGHEKVARSARAVAGEDSSGSVAAMRGGRQAQQQDARVRVAEPGHRSSPIRLVPEGGAPFPRDFLAVTPQTRTTIAADDGAADEVESGHAKALRLPVFLANITAFAEGNMTGTSGTVRLFSSGVLASLVVGLLTGFSASGQSPADRKDWIQLFNDSG
jgi:hypothetical protein